MNHNPVKFLRRIDQHKLDGAADNPAYVARYEAVMGAFDAYMHPASTWWGRTYPEHEQGADGLFLFRVRFARGACRSIPVAWAFWLATTAKLPAI